MTNYITQQHTHMDLIHSEEIKLEGSNRSLQQATENFIPNHIEVKRIKANNNALHAKHQLFNCLSEMTYADDSTKRPYYNKQYNFSHVYSPSPSPTQKSCLYFASATTCIIPSCSLSNFLRHFLAQCFCIPAHEVNIMSDQGFKLHHPQNFSQRTLFNSKLQFTKGNLCSQITVYKRKPLFPN